MSRLIAGIAVTTLIALATPAAAGSPAGKPPAGPATRPTTQPVAVNPFCAVEGEGHAIDPAVTLEHQGKTIGFCCPDCVETFKRDPARYLAKLK